MNIAPTSVSVPSTEAQSPFVAASSLYKSALAMLDTSKLPVDPRVLVSSALQNVTMAVELLTPVAGGGDPFAGRAAASSIDAAKRAVAALNTAQGTIDHPGSQLSFEQLVGMAKSSITIAEQALWQE